MFQKNFLYFVVVIFKGEDYDQENTESRTGSFNESSRTDSFCEMTQERKASRSFCDETICVNNPEDLVTRFQEVSKTKERLECERVAMLDSLCKQVERNNSLLAELDDLKNAKSRPASLISHSESLSSLISEKCSQCTSSSKNFSVNLACFCSKFYFTIHIF